MKLLTRGLLALWGLFFATLAMRGAIHPTVWTGLFSIMPASNGVNTLRADFSAFFLVAAIPPLLVAAYPRFATILMVPIGLFGIALLFRILGLAMGDTADDAVHQALIIEALTVMFMLGARHVLRDDDGTAPLDNPS